MSAPTRNAIPMLRPLARRSLPPTHKRSGVAIALAAAFMFAAPYPPASAAEHAAAPAWTTTITQCGKASWYGKGFAGKPTANGEIYDPQTMTAAHPTLPFGTRVRVTRTGAGKTVVLRINNRGPYKRGRIIDVSEKAAQFLSFKNAGITQVCLTAVVR